MTSFTDYQTASGLTARYPTQHPVNFMYLALGAAGEAGEIADKVKKAVRDHNGDLSGDRREALILEMGDVLWYLAQLASELDIDFTEVAQRNLEKLSSRKARNVIAGSGDYR